MIVGNTLSNHPNDKRVGVPTVQAILTELGRPDAVAIVHGYFGLKPIQAFEAVNINPCIAGGRDAHHLESIAQEYG